MTASWSWSSGVGWKLGGTGSPSPDGLFRFWGHPWGEAHCGTGMFPLHRVSGLAGVDSQAPCPRVTGQCPAVSLQCPCSVLQCPAVLSSLCEPGPRVSCNPPPKSCTSSWMDAPGLPGIPKCAVSIPKCAVSPCWELGSLSACLPSLQLPPHLHSCCLAPALG